MRFGGGSEGAAEAPFDDLAEPADKNPDALGVLQDPQDLLPRPLGQGLHVRYRPGVSRADFEHVVYR